MREREGGEKRKRRENEGMKGVKGGRKKKGDKRKGEEGEMANHEGLPQRGGD